jgi:hypothetical protein
MARQAGETGYEVSGLGQAEVGRPEVGLRVTGPGTVVVVCWSDRDRRQPLVLGRLERCFKLLRKFGCEIQERPGDPSFTYICIEGSYTHGVAEIEQRVIAIAAQD